MKQMKKKIRQKSDLTGAALLALGLIGINLAGLLVGIYYYSYQLAYTNPLWWIFVIDCPLYVGLFALVLMGELIGIRNDFFSYLVAVGLLKYGAWTVVVILGYSWFFLSPENGLLIPNMLLLIAHLGMAAEGFVFFFNRPRPWMLAGCLGWFLFNDFIDYWGPAVHPLMPRGIDYAPLAAYTIASSFAACLLIYFLREHWNGIPLWFLPTEKKQAR